VDPAVKDFLGYTGLPSLFIVYRPRVIVPEATASVVEWSEFLATDPEVPGSIPGTSRFTKK
jgi:hypothetical protein